MNSNTRADRLRRVQANAIQSVEAYYAFFTKDHPNAPAFDTLTERQQEAWCAEFQSVLQSDGAARAE